MEFFASAAFGLEGLVKKDLERLGAREVRPLRSGGVAFEGEWSTGFAANLWLRTADRVHLVMARFEARSFEELFQGVRAIRWEDVLPADAALPVRAQCARSQLMSPSDCQSIAKKAAVERMKKAYNLNWLSESGPAHEICVAIHEDAVTVSLNMSGPSLSRRGYRTWNGEAPLRETLAAALVFLSPWRNNMPLYDPCCGTATLLIEAALLALDRAPGLGRSFDCEAWPQMPRAEIARLRREATERLEAGSARPIDIAGSDIDPEALELARRHIRQAGLEGRIRLLKADLRDVNLPAGPGVILTNPPYGERMGDRRAAQAVAKQLGALGARSQNWALCAITSDRGFEKAIGRRAARRRRLYNGRLECEFMTFADGRERGK